MLCIKKSYIITPHLEIVKITNILYFYKNNQQIQNRHFGYKWCGHLLKGNLKCGTTTFQIILNR